MTPAFVSIGIFAWNEESAITSLLNSLFEQNLFQELARRDLTCEIVLVGNGCTDATPEVAAKAFARQSSHHPFRQAFTCRVADLKQRGKLNAWNRFVHELADPHAKYFCMADADIIIHRKETLWNMLAVLEQDAHASIAVDRPCKDILYRNQKAWRDRLSLAAAQITAASQAQLCAQLYCIRAEVARNIYLPRDLSACEDGFIKALVCTDFGTRKVDPGRIRLAEQAEHTFEAYTSFRAILKNQKRQIIGQTIVHILVDDYLKCLPLASRVRIGQNLKAKDASDPAWLKRLIRDHLRRRKGFWRLYPGMLGHRFRKLAGLNLIGKLRCAPAALGGLAFTFAASFLAHRFLKAGATDYWPRAERLGFKEAEPVRISPGLSHDNPK